MAWDRFGGSRLLDSARLFSEERLNRGIPLMHPFVEYGFETLIAFQVLRKTRYDEQIASCRVCAGPVRERGEVHGVAVGRPSHAVRLRDPLQHLAPVAIDQRLNLGLSRAIGGLVIRPPCLAIDRRRAFEGCRVEPVDARVGEVRGIVGVGEPSRDVRQRSVEDQVSATRSPGVKHHGLFPHAALGVGEALEATGLVCGRAGHRLARRIGHFRAGAAEHVEIVVQVEPHLVGVEPEDRRRLGACAAPPGSPES